MRHRKTGVKLNRTPSHRKAMFRNLVTSLLKHDRIRTTDAKAKELRSWADHIITLAKRGDLHARRQALAIVMEKEVVHKIFEQAGERFGSISGGYTRVIKLGRRPGDAAPVSMVELVAAEEKSKKKKTKKKKTASADETKKLATEKKAAEDKTEKADTSDSVEEKSTPAPKKKTKPKAEAKKETPAAKKAATAETKAKVEKKTAAKPKKAAEEKKTEE